jgi:hypothetical protein
MYHDVTEITRGKNQKAEKDTGIEGHQEKFFLLVDRVTKLQMSGKTACFCSGLMLGEQQKFTQN